MMMMMISIITIYFPQFDQLSSRGVGRFLKCVSAWNIWWINTYYFSQKQSAWFGQEGWKGCKMLKQTLSNDSGWYVLSGQHTIVYFRNIPERMSLSVTMGRAWPCWQIVQQIETSARGGITDEMISF